MTSPDAAASSRIALLGLGLLLLGFAAIVIRSAWLCDDAYITFRSVDNFIGGHGLRWNVSERVESYTHPLWMLLLTASAAVTGDFAIAPLVLSIGLSVGAVTGLAVGIAPDRARGAVAVCILGLSRSFVDYSTSGLENPLSHLWLVLFALIYFGDQRGDQRAGERSVPQGLGPERDEQRRLLLCMAVAGLAVLTRPDTLLLYAPALATRLWSRRSARTLAGSILALSPLLLWECFSLFYYGFAFPNTAYAKLGAGIPAAALITQGLLYLRFSFEVDPIAAIAIGTGCTLALLRRDRSTALALGTLLYLVYVVRIGGDFMAGRHLSLPLLCSVILLCRALPRSPAWSALAVSAALALGLAAPHPTLFGDAWIRRGEAIPERHGIKDERAVYAPYTAPWGGWELQEHPWAEQGRALGRRGPAVVPRVAVGLFAFHAGPEVHVVDANALADPLLARLPARERGEGWRIGHHTRDLPEGYLETLRSGENRITDPKLAEVYESLGILTRGELWSWQRLREIARHL